MFRNFHMLITVVVSLLLWSVVCTPLASQVPQKLHFQGILTTTGGVTVPDGQYQLTFRLYTSATTGSPVWTETQNVTVSSGIFSVELGTVMPLNLSFDQPYYLGITVGSGSEMAPRIPLLGSPYSFYARQAGSAAVGGDLSGNSTSATVVGIQGRSVSAVAPSTGQVLQWDGTQWVPTLIGSSGGGSGWSTSGNVLSGTEFLGSVNAQPVVIKSAGSEAMWIDVDQQVGIGVTTPTNRLHVQAGSNPLRLEGLGMLSNAATVLVVDTDGVVYTTSASGLVSSSGWGLSGNSGTNPASDFLGTTDNQPLVIRVNNQQALRIEPGASPNLLGGYGSNSISSGVVGAVIGGGGKSSSVNTVTDDYGVVGGGVGNQAGNNSGTTTDAQYATVGGGYGNTASGNYSTVGGGSENIASGNYNTVSGGKSNTSNGLNSTVGGGIFNIASGHSATVGGGLDNEARGWYSTVGGGANNTASGTGSVVGGGTINTASGTAAAVSGGSGNTAAGDYSWAGGRSMYLATSASHSFVWGYATSTTAITASDAFLIGPYGNDYRVGINVADPTAALHVTAGSWSNPLRLEGLRSMSNASTVLVVDTDGVVYTTSASGLVSSSGWGLAGNSGTNPASDFLGTTDNQPLVVKVNNQQAMRIEPGSSPNLLGGYGSNSISSGVVGAVIGGGGKSSSVNTVTDDYGVVGGGVGNQAGNNSGTTTDAQYATVGGGYGNTASGNYSTVGGGSENIASGNYNTVSGGKSNTSNGLNSTVGGGIFNIASGHSATVGGGLDNEARGWYSTVGGGANNTASGTGSVVGGGTINTASGTAAAVSGGSGNTAAGDYSWAGGRSMYLATSASHSFVWGYATSTTAITASDAFLIGPYGNTYKVGVNIASPVYALELPNNTSQTVGKARANAWVTYSDGRVKSHITDIGEAEALEKISALRPVYYLHHSSRWTANGKLEILKGGEYRYGFIAQELAGVVPEAVYEPEDSTQDLYGVDYSELIPILTAALQAQQQIIEQQRLVNEQQQTEIQQQRQEIVQLRHQVAALRQEVNRSKETQAEVTVLRQLVLQLQRQLQQLQSNAAVGQQSGRK